MPGPVLRLHRDVARALRENGIPVTKGRDGPYARVLEIVREALGRPLPAESFPELKRAADNLKKKT